MPWCHVSSLLLKSDWVLEMLGLGSPSAISLHFLPASGLQLLATLPVYGGVGFSDFSAAHGCPLTSDSELPTGLCPEDLTLLSGSFWNSAPGLLPLNCLMSV